jgi:hypothetical protein
MQHQKIKYNCSHKWNKAIHGMTHCNHNKWTLEAPIMSNLTRLKIGINHNKNNDFQVSQNEPSQLFVHSWPWLYNQCSCNAINIKLMVLL